jgi:hypothetical protein
MEKVGDFRDERPRASGGCLCGAVRYTVTGPLRDVLVCHCSVCRRTHGHEAAYAACDRTHLVVESAAELRWHEHDGARRAFCGRCGGRLFWERPDRPTISITAGTLDEPTGLRTMGHIYTEPGADYGEPAPS